VTCLVTGGRGFLGSHVVRRLRETVDDEVLAPARAELELTNLEAITAYISAHSVSTIIHLAASLDKRETPEAQARQWRDTFEAGRNVMLAAAECAVERVLAAGTVDEVGRAHGVVGPDAALEPSSTYGLCKSLVLETARFLTYRHKMSVEWFRPTAIYGPGQRGPMLVPAAFATALGSGNAQFTSGEQKRDSTYVDDVVDWMVRAVRVNGAQSSGLRVHHVGSAKPVAVGEVLSRVSALTGFVFELGAIPRREHEPEIITVPEYHDDRSPLDGWRPMVDLADGLERTYSWWQQNQ